MAAGRGKNRCDTPLWLRKLYTALRLTRRQGITNTVRFALANWRHLAWKWKAERSFRRFSDREIVLVENVNGFNMFVSTKDFGIGMEIFYSRVHEPLVTKLLNLVVKRDDIVLECGANIGYYSLLLSRLVRPKGRVIAVEPNPEIAKILKMNLCINDIDNVEVIETALGQNEGEADFYVCQSSNLSSFKNSWLDDFVFVRRVPMQRIDSLVAQLGYSINAIRMDVEGFEVEILEGAVETLRKNSPKILIEYHKEKIGVQQAEETLRWLSEEGYQIMIVIPRDYDWPFMKQQAPIFIPASITDFLHSDLWQMPHLKTYTIVFVSKNEK
jgi:FkbM family methyltransferase